MLSCGRVHLEGYKEMSSILADQFALVYESQCGGIGGVGGSAANEYSCAHHVTLSPNKLWRSTSKFNLCVQWCTPPAPFFREETRPVTHWKTEKEKQLVAGRGGGDWRWDQIIRPGESLVLYYQSFKTLRV